MVFVVLLFLLPISLSFSATEKSVFLKLNVFGFKVFSFDSQSKRTSSAKAKPASKEPKDVTLSQRLESLRTILMVIMRILHHVGILPRMKKVCFDLTFGLSDAAKTGMAAGGIYALVYGIQARLLRSRRVKLEEVKVTPDFQTSVFSLKCSGIITTCLAHIMGIAIVALAVVARQRKKEE